MRIYLDHNAGSPIRPQARDAIMRLFADHIGNPASVHQPGQSARRALEQARADVAALINGDPRQVVFTSGGTESNNIAIFGAIGAKTRRRLITSSIEHSSTLEPIAELEQRGFEVVRIAPDGEGRLPADRVVVAIDSNTALVSLALANAEIGTLQDLYPVADACAAAGATFHIDAAQALGRIAIDSRALRCDLMTMSGHKLGAPAGIGALYVRDAACLRPTVHGGPQENGLRAGSPNLIGAVGFGAAASWLLDNRAQEAQRVSNLANLLLANLLEAIPGLRLNGPIRDRIASTLNLTFPGVLGESMLIALDLEGVNVSMGSACAAGSVEPSHVLLAIGRSAAEARSSLRLSVGWDTTAEDIERASEIIARVWRRVCHAEPAPEHVEALR